MNWPAHPSIRRLWALGGAAAGAIARLDRTFPTLTALCCDLGELGLVSERAVEPLLREVDLAAMLQRTTAKEPRSESSEVGDVGPEGVPAAARRAAASRPAMAHSHSAISTTRGPDDDTTPALAATAPGEHPSPRQERRPEPVHHVSTRPDAAAAATALRTSRTEAMKNLRRRAARSGAATAIDTVVGGIPASPAVTAVLAHVHGGDRHAGSGHTFDSRTAYARADEMQATSRSANAPTAPAAQLVRALHRIESARGRHSRTSAGASPASPPGLRPSPDGDGAAGGERFVPPDTATIGGLRGLAARARSRGDAPSTDAVRSAVLDQERVLPACALERMREAELAEHLERLLRREARGEGIDLDEVEA